MPDAKVEINPEKPRKGYFEVKDSTGKVYVSLPSMPRPFKPLKELDLDKLGEEVVAALEAK